MSEHRSATSAPEASGAPWGRVVLGVLALAALIALGRAAGARIDEFRAWIDGLGAVGPIAFVAAYAIGVAAFLPGAALTIAGGAIFGVVKGTAIVFGAALLGSTLAFLIARYLARGFVEQRIAGNAQFAAIDRAIGQQGRKIVFLLRLSPVFPFSLGNYALGLTRVGLADYVIAGAGMLPGTLLYVYLGSVATDVASAAAVGGAASGRTALTIVGLAATALVTIFVTRIARRALADASGRDLGSKE
ncbi:MAG TPA: TVP38/TMEM64 family protein [Myxococcota bacterium]